LYLLIKDVVFRLQNIVNADYIDYLSADFVIALLVCYAVH
jgi:aminoglycoside phosphotransferase family enzyme